MNCDGQWCQCSQPLYRPRGALARALYHKQIVDNRLASFDYSKWYSVDKATLDSDLGASFVQFNIDDETERFIASSTEASDNILLQIFHSFVKMFLGFFMTQTSINGLLGRGSMFVFSRKQFGELSARNPDDEGFLLDLGAGDGSVTSVMAPFYSSVHATELSKQMRTLLTGKGFKLIEDNDLGRERYETVSCLNVLDRCDKPIKMLSEIRRATKPNGIVIIAVVLPFRPYVESGRNHKPSEYLPILGVTFEEQVTSFVHQVLLPHGFKVERWTRLPYLCEGDLSQSYYWLDDAVFVLSNVDSSKSDTVQLSTTEDENNSTIMRLAAKKKSKLM